MKWSMNRSASMSVNRKPASLPRTSVMPPMNTMSTPSWRRLSLRQKAISTTQLYPVPELSALPSSCRTRQPVLVSIRTTRRIISMAASPIWDRCCRATGTGMIPISTRKPHTTQALGQSMKPAVSRTMRKPSTTSTPSKGYARTSGISSATAAMPVMTLMMVCMTPEARMLKFLRM